MVPHAAIAAHHLGSSLRNIAAKKQKTVAVPKVARMTVLGLSGLLDRIVFRFSADLVYGHQYLLGKLDEDSYYKVKPGGKHCLPVLSCERTINPFRM